MADTVSVNDVTTDLAFLMSLTKIITVDEQNFWYDPVTKKRFLHSHGDSDQGREVALFQDPMPRGDVLFFNPFAEGFGGKSPAVNVYYRLIRIAANLDLRTAMMFVVQSIYNAKVTAAEGSDYSISHIVTRMSSVPVDRKTSLYDLCDEKLVDEFTKLFDRTNDETFFVPYLPQQTKGSVKIDALTDPTWDEKYGKDIRKKSLLAFKTVLMGVLGINKVEELSQFTVKYDPTLKTSAKFYTILSVYQRLYTRFNDILPEAYAASNGGEAKDDEGINLEELGAVIERFPQSYTFAKHMVQPAPVSKGATDTTVSDTSGLRIGGAGAPRRFAGPEIVDSFGRRGLPAQPLQLGGNAGQPVQAQSRFKPHVINAQAVDPFAPAVRSSNSDAFGGGLQLGTTNFGGQFGNRSQFGDNQYTNQGFGFSGGGLDLNAPSNFGSSGSRRFF
jgi:hypothetical protein